MSKKKPTAPTDTVAAGANEDDVDRMRALEVAFEGWMSPFLDEEACGMEEKST